jgi:hypothetical protein
MDSSEDSSPLGNRRLATTPCTLFSYSNESPEYYLDNIDTIDTIDYIDLC